MLLRRRRASLGVTALMAAAVALAGIGPVPAAGAQAPEFTLELLTGGTLSLASLRGSPTILLFWAPW